MRVDPRDWEEVRLSISINPEQLMRLCQVTPATWRRWKTQGPPACVVALAQALAADLSVHGWPGWSIQGGYLWPPGARRTRDAYSMRDVEWIAAARWIIEGYDRLARDQERLARTLKGDSEPALECMHALRLGLIQACEAYDGLRGEIGGAPRVFEETRRGWRARR